MHMGYKSNLFAHSGTGLPFVGRPFAYLNEPASAAATIPAAMLKMLADTYDLRGDRFACGLDLEKGLRAWAGST